MRAKLALSTLCENPSRRTGLSTLFPEFVSHARALFPEVSWVVFAGKDAPWPEDDPGVEICRDFPSNEQPLRRLVADHFDVAPEARRRGAHALLTVGFVPLWRSGLPVAMQVFAVDPVHAGGRLRSAYRRWSLARGLRRALLVVANSEWTRERLGPSLSPIFVSPEGLRHDLFSPRGTRGGPRVPAHYILWASNLYPYKRLELCLAVYARLPQALRSQYPLVVVGGDWGSGRANAEAAAERLGIRRDVVFLGWVEDGDLPSLYRGARAHVLSTSQETFGRSVLESMACGCLNVIQDLPVLHEVAGDSALYVDYSDPEAASAALARGCTDLALRAQLIAAGVERAKQFSFERLARERVGVILARVVPRDS